MTKTREQEFNAIHKKLWSNTKIGDIPDSYIERINELQTQASLIVLTTKEDIDLMIEAASKEDFDRNERVDKFCEAMYDLDSNLALDDGESMTENIAKAMGCTPSALSEALARARSNNKKVVGPNPAQGSS